MRKLALVLLATLLIAGNAAVAQINAYAINYTLAGPGQKSFDINGDGTDDFLFDILSLPQGSLAARVDAINQSQILDNSTYGYPDTLNTWDPVTGFFHTGIGVLGTFTNAGQFNGAGKKFLGIKINASGTLLTGWFELRVTSGRDTLEVLSCGYLTTPNGTIGAGQLYMTGLAGLSGPQHVSLYPNPVSGNLYVGGLSNAAFEYALYTLSGICVRQGVAETTLDVSGVAEGMYFIEIKAGEWIVTRKILVSK